MPTIAREYRFHLSCPQCHRKSVVVEQSSKTTLALNCGDCLIERVEVVPLKIEKVDVY
jgi:transcription elongation factor Elf1